MNKIIHIKGASIFDIARQMMLSAGNHFGDGW